MSDVRPSNTLVYGLGGAKGSGKDTLAELYQQIFQSRDVRIIGMSDPLRDSIYIMNPTIIFNADWHGIQRGSIRNYRDLYTEAVEEFSTDARAYTHLKTHPEIRGWLQKFGTELGRNLLGENIWVDIASRKIQQAIDEGADTVFLTGIRFPNELESIQRFAGANILVERSGINSNDSHASENSLVPRDFDFIIMNDGSLEDLKNEVRTRL